MSNTQTSNKQNSAIPPHGCPYCNGKGYIETHEWTPCLHCDGCGICHDTGVSFVCPICQGRKGTIELRRRPCPHH